jgi:hypothetical protein
MPERDFNAEARAIFASAQDYHIACESLLEARKENGSRQFRVAGPMMSLAGFACELFLKCLLTDFKISTIPRTHELSELFKNFPRKLKTFLQKEWATCVQQTNSGLLIEKLDVGEAIDSVSAHFTNWRYRFEQPRGSLDFSQPSVFFMMTFLGQVMIRRHPDWIDESDDHYKSTFPTP